MLNGIGGHTLITKMFRDIILILVILLNLIPTPSCSQPAKNNFFPTVFPIRAFPVTQGGFSFIQVTRIITIFPSIVPFCLPLLKDSLFNNGIVLVNIERQSTNESVFSGLFGCFISKLVA